MGQRLTVAQAAELLQISPQMVRYHMEIGSLPIGRVLGHSGGHRKTYLIYRELVEREIGRRTN